MAAETTALVAPVPTVIEHHHDVLSLIFEGRGVDFYKFRDRIVVIAAEYGAALGYSRSGLVDQISGDWRAEFTRGQHYEVLDGEELRAFKELSARGGKMPPRYAKSLMLLTEAGADLAALKSEKPAGKVLRALLVEHVLPRLRRGEAVSVPVAPRATVSGPTLLETDPSLSLPEPERRAALLLRAAEAATGQVRERALGAVVALLAPANVPAAAAVEEPSVAPPPAPQDPPDTWLSATSIAARASARLNRRVTAEEVGRAATAVGARTDAYAHLRCGVVVPRRNGAKGDAVSWHYEPTLAIRILNWVITHPPQSIACAKAA